MIQSYRAWDTFLYVISYLFMYLVILDTDSYFKTKVSLEGSILIILWIDLLF